MNAVTYRNIELLQIEKSTGESRARIREIITEDEQWRLWHELSAIIGTIHGGAMPYFRAVQILGHDAVNRALAIPSCKWNSNFAHQKRSTDLENTDSMPMKILPLCTFS